jgi:hypothetical protein
MYSVKVPVSSLVNISRPPLTGLELLKQLPFAVWLRSSEWAYPSLEVAHILGIALMLGSVFLVDFKLLGFLKRPRDEISAQALSHFALMWTLTGFSIIVMSGSLMLFARLSDLIGNPAFLWKIGLISCGLSKASLLHSRHGLARADIGSKLQAVLSILIWIGTVACGRWIAYV